MSSTKQFRHVTTEERKTLEQFARLEISLDELRRRLGGMLEFDFAPSERRLTSYFLLPQPGIRIEKHQIKSALDKHWRGEITDRELADWATMLLLNEAYDWEGSDEDEIAELLNELSMLTAEPEEQP